MFEFESEIAPAEISVVGYDDDNYDYESSDFIVKWKCDFGLVKWGIKNVNVHIIQVIGTIMLSPASGDEEDDTNEVIEINCFSIDPEWKITNNVSFDNDGNLWLVDMTIDLEDKTIDIR